MFREELKSRMDAGVESARRVRFAECDYSKKEMTKFVLNPEKI